MATRAVLEVEAQALLDDTAADRFALADIRLYLDEGQMEFNRLARLFVTTFTVTTVSGTETYTLTDANSNWPVGPVLKIIAGTDAVPTGVLWKTADVKLDRLFGEGWVTTTGTPSRWLQGHRNYAQIRLYPTPNAAFTYTVYAAGQPAVLSGASSEPDIPEQYHYALPFYAAYKCLLRLSDANSVSMAQIFKDCFDKILQQARAEAQERSA